MKEANCTSCSLRFKREQQKRAKMEETQRNRHYRFQFRCGVSEEIESEGKEKDELIDAERRCSAKILQLYCRPLLCI